MAWKEYEAQAPPHDSNKIQLANELQQIEQDAENKVTNAETKAHREKEARDRAKERDDQAMEDFKTSKATKELERCRMVLEAYVDPGKLKAEAEALQREGETRGPRKKFEDGYDALGTD